MYLPAVTAVPCRVGKMARAALKSVTIESLRDCGMRGGSEGHAFAYASSCAAVLFLHTAGPWDSTEENSTRVPATLPIVSMRSCCGMLTHGQQAPAGTRDGTQGEGCAGTAPTAADAMTREPRGEESLLSRLPRGVLPSIVDLLEPFEVARLATCCKQWRLTVLEGLPYLRPKCLQVTLCWCWLYMPRGNPPLCRLRACEVSIQGVWLAVVGGAGAHGGCRHEKEGNQWVMRVGRGSQFMHHKTSVLLLCRLVLGVGCTPGIMHGQAHRAPIAALCTQGRLAIACRPGLPITLFLSRIMLGLPGSLAVELRGHPPALVPACSLCLCACFACCEGAAAAGQ
jgi:hypothetical protein